MKLLVLVSVVSAVLFTGCEGGNNAPKNGAVLDDSEKGVVTAPQDSTAGHRPGEMPGADMTTATENASETTPGTR